MFSFSKIEAISVKNKEKVADSGVRAAEMCIMRTEVGFSIVFLSSIIHRSTPSSDQTMDSSGLFLFLPSFPPSILPG